LDKGLKIWITPKQNTGNNAGLRENRNVGHDPLMRMALDPASTADIPAQDQPEFWMK